MDCDLIIEEAPPVIELVAVVLVDGSVLVAVAVAAFIPPRPTGLPSPREKKRLRMIDKDNGFLIKDNFY